METKNYINNQILKAHAKYIRLKEKINILKSIYKINESKISGKNKMSLVLGSFGVFKGGNYI